MAKLLATKPAKAVAIAVANKLARIALIGMFKAQLRKLILIEKLENAEPEARDFDETYRVSREELLTL